MQERRRTSSDRQRLLDKLVRELVRAEARSVEHARREARRLGETPPVAALRTVADHAEELGARLDRVLADAGLVVGASLVARWTDLRHRVVERALDAERAYQAVLHDLRHGIDVVRVLREAARLDELFAVIRWCDDWLAVRRGLVDRAEAELAWFESHPRTARSVADGLRRTTPSHAPGGPGTTPR